MNLSEKDKKTFRGKLKLWQQEPLAFLEDIWGLTPQRIKPEYEHMMWTSPASEFKPHMFFDFIRGENITWQQFLFFRAITWAVQNKAKRRISIESGHGTGKSASLAMIIIWYITCHKNAQIPCTAPTQHQLHDVLWKEIRIWLDRMPKMWLSTYDLQDSYLKISDHPDTWFARARTARKEAPEALAGVHGEHVCFIVDEASGVPDEVFNTAEGSLTGDNVLVFLISNHTRLLGYFHDTHNSDKDAWQRLSFNSEESPIVDVDYVSRIEKKHGRDSDEFRVRVLGTSPRADAVDDKGYVPLFNMGLIRVIPQAPFSEGLRMGIDPSGEGKDETSIAIRDNFQAQIIAREKISSGKSIAQLAMTLMDKYNLEAEDVYVDSFGVGVDTIRELALAGKAVNAVNVGTPAEDRETYINLRAEAFWRFYKWVLAGGGLVEGGDWKNQLLVLKYRRELSGKLKIMGKEEMRKEGIPSPNDADAVMLTFTVGENDWGNDSESTTWEDDGVD